MAFQVSPGINVSELDLTASTQQISVSDAAFAGPFLWGPALVPTNIASETDLVSIFGKPDDSIYAYWFAAQSFLAYSNLLHAIRALAPAALNATVTAATLDGAVTGEPANTVWVAANTQTFNTGYGVSPVLVEGQTITIGGVPFIVDTVTNTASFKTTTAPAAVANLTGAVDAACTTSIFTNTASSFTTTGLAQNMTILVGTATYTVNVVTNSCSFTVKETIPGNITAASVRPLVIWANTVTTQGALIKNSDHYDSVYAPGTITGFGSWAAKYAGELGNSLKVSVCPSQNAYLDANTHGSIAIVAGNNTVVGTATPKFDTELVAGDYLVVGGTSYQIASITNSTYLILATTPYISTTAAAGQWSHKWEYAFAFDAAPGTSAYTSNRSGSGDELHVVVVDEDGGFTGVPGTILEKYAFLSKAVDAKTPNGDNNYYITTLNRQSRYIWWLTAPTTNTSNWGGSAVNTTFGGDNLPTTVSLSGGQTDNVNISAGDLETAYDLFNNVDNVDISLVVTGPASTTLASYIIQNLCEARLDCVAFVSPEYADVVNNVGSELADITSFRNSLPSSSYAFLDSGWKYTYDKYNDKYRWVPLNGDIAGIAARSDTTNDPWWSPAGFTRGNVKNVIKLAWSPKQIDRDGLYKIGVNPVVSFPSAGVVLYGDKTLLNRPSAFDRVNVRRLFIILEKTISRLSRAELFEFNDEFTRSQFRNVVEPYLRDVKARRGITDYRVVCDGTNNTATVIDANSFVGDIYVKPARSINYIQLNFVAVSTGVSFQEVTGTI